MTKLQDLRKIAEKMFPGIQTGLGHLMVSWAVADPEGELQRLLTGSGIDIEGFERSLRPYLKKPATEDRNLLIDCIKNVSGEEVKGAHLLKMLCEAPGNRLTRSLISSGMDFKRVLDNIRSVEKDKTSLSKIGIQVVHEASGIVKYGRDLTTQAAEGAFDELCSRPNEIDRLMDVLLRKRKGNPVLTGPAGVGKTALVELLAVEIVKKRHPLFMDFRIFEISMGKMVAGTKYRGDFEARFENVLREITEAAPAIMFIDEIHLLAGAGRAEGVNTDGANLIKPFLARDKFRLIGATTSAEYHRYIVRDEALARRFQEIKLKDPNPEILLKMAIGHARVLSSHHGIEINENAIKKAIELTDRHIVNRHQPDKTIDLLDSAAVSARRKGFTILEADDLLNTLARITGIPVGTLTGDDKRLLKNLRNSLRSRIIGQNDAIDKVVARLVQQRMDVGSSDRPAGVFLFAGDTGVGKTELARSLAATFFGDERRLIHLDLAEYPGPGGVHKLIGAPSGFLGSEEAGILIKGLQVHPSCVILFDEIEKASSEVHNVLLGLLDNGRITSSTGELMDARQCVIIMTTNAVSSKDLSKQPLGFGDHAGKSPDPFEILKKTFPSEFLGRMDEIIPFRQLMKDDFKKILKLRINEAIQRLYGKGIRLEFDEARLTDHLLKDLETERTGARGISRLLERKLLQPLAMALLQDKDGQETKVELRDKFYENGEVSLE